jgi:zinc transport system substrate-binding protein
VRQQGYYPVHIQPVQFLFLMIQRYLFLIAIILLLGGMSGCNMHSENTDGKPVVSVSILPLQYFVDRLSGEALEVNVMIPPGASHGTYSPTTMQFQKLSRSGIYFMVGHLGYERSFIHRISELNPGMKLIKLSDHTELIAGEEVDHGDHVHEGGIDPHIWMSPKVMMELLPIMGQAIKELYPALQEEVDKQLVVVMQEIQAVHQAFVSLSASLTEKRFLIFHPALTYLARDYDFEQVSVEHGGKEPSPALLSQLIRRARAETIPVIFIQEEYDMRNARLISEETGASLVQINPMAYNWIDHMYELHSIMKEELQ